MQSFVKTFFLYVLQSEFQLICKEKNVNQNLDKLDDCIGNINEQELEILTNKKMVLPKQNPQHQILQLRINSKKNQKQQLEAMLKKLDEDLNFAKNQLTQTQEAVKTAESKLAAIVNDFEQVRNQLQFVFL